MEILSRLQGGGGLPLTVVRRPRQGHDEASAPPRPALHTDVTAMIEDDLAADRQPQPGSPDHAFSSEKRLKDVGQILGRNSRTGVGDYGFDHIRGVWAPVWPAARTESDTATRPDRLHGVDAQVEQDLLQLLRVAQDRRDVIGELQGHLHAADVPAVSDDLPDPADDLVQAHSAELRLRAARQSQELADKGTDLLDLADDDAEKGAVFLGQSSPL